MNTLAEQVIIDIITEEMGLAADQIWVRDQNRKIPPDNRLYVVVGFVDGTVISSTRSTAPFLTTDNRVTPETGIRVDAYLDTRITAEGDVRESAEQPGGQRITTEGGNRVFPFETLKELSHVINGEHIQIDIFSRSIEAVQRRWEPIAALKSIYSQQQQEAEEFKIFSIPQSLVNTSETEGGSRLNKFSMVITCHVWYRKEKVLLSDGDDYYDDFHTRVDDERTIGTGHGIIEFEIDQTGVK